MIQVPLLPEGLAVAGGEEGALQGAQGDDVLLRGEGGLVQEDLPVGDVASHSVQLGGDCDGQRQHPCGAREKVQIIVAILPVNSTIWSGRLIQYQLY